MSSREMIRAVNASLDPERVAEALVARATEWVPAPGWLVLAADDSGGIQPMATRALAAHARRRRHGRRRVGDPDG